MLNLLQASKRSHEKTKNTHMVMIHFKNNHQTVQAVSLMSPQVCLWEGDQEEEVSFWASGPSPTSADV